MAGQVHKAEIKLIRSDIGDRERKGEILKLIYLTAILLAGCMPKSNKVVNLSPTPSMCLNGVIFSMSHDGCDNITIVESPMENVDLLQCRYSYVHQNSEPSMWLENEFYIMETRNLIRIDGGLPLCSDGNVTIVVAEKD